MNIDQLEEQLSGWMEKLHFFEMERINAADPSIKFNIHQKIKNEITPAIDKIHAKLAAQVAAQNIPAARAEPLVGELLPAVQTLPREDLPESLRAKLDEILAAIQALDTTAAAKLKVALPIIPLLAQYEMELDTEKSLGGIWRKIKQTIF